MSGMKLCPFCGEQVFTPLVASLDDGYTRCGLCGAKMQHRRWQTRPIEDDLRKRIAELEEAQRWIPVSERLPEENQQILSTDGKEFYLDYYARWEGKDNPPCFCDGLSWAVTHWMPLPEPPEVQDDRY
jgi:transcription elongation factor Elf1